MIRLFPSGSKKSKDKRDWNNCQCSCKFYGDSFIQSREPRLYMESQVEAAAVTEEVSFTAVPAKMPKNFSACLGKTENGAKHRKK